MQLLKIEASEKFSKHDIPFVLEEKMQNILLEEINMKRKVGFLEDKKRCKSGQKDKRWKMGWKGNKGSERGKYSW